MSTLRHIYKGKGLHMFMADDPNFTGSCKSFTPKERIRVTLPAIVNIAQVDNYTDGKITSTYFDWTVVLSERVIARRDVYKPAPKTHKAALAAARRAARAYSDYVASNLDEV